MSIPSSSTTSSRIIIPRNQSRIGTTADNDQGDALSVLQACGGAELVRISAIAELTQIDQWVAWKLISRNGRRDKVPFNVATNKPASTSDPNTWDSYAAALRVRTQYNGIGFVFSTDDSYTGIDFDGCRELKTGEIAPWAWTWIQKLNSYTEVSPSGTGVKVWIRGTLPKNIGKGRGSVGHVGIEAYSHSRFFCFTAQHLPGTPETINEAQPILDELYRFLRPEKPKPEPRRTERNATLGEQAAEHLTLPERYAQARAYIRDRYDLIETLEAAGAEKTASGFSCPFCAHSHTTTLTIEPGGMVGYSHSPLCKLSSEKGFDVTNVLILKDNYPGFDKLARALAPHCFPKPRPGTWHTMPEYLTPAAVQRRNQDRVRKHAEYQAVQEQRHAWQVAQTVRLAADPAACDTYRQAWAIHNTYFGSVGQHCVSLARMAAELGEVALAEEPHIRRMQRANTWLIAHGYLIRKERTERRNDGKQHTNYWEPAPSDGLRVSQDTGSLQEPVNILSIAPAEVLRVSDAALPKSTENALGDTLVNLESRSLEKLDSTCEARATPPSCAIPADVGDWQSYDPPIGAEELNALDVGPLQAPQSSSVHTSADEARPAPFVRRSGPRWCAFDGRCYSWHCTEALARAQISSAPGDSHILESPAGTDIPVPTAPLGQQERDGTAVNRAVGTFDSSLRVGLVADHLADIVPGGAECAGASDDPTADWTVANAGPDARRARTWNHSLPPKAFYTFMRRPVLEMSLREETDNLDELEAIVDESELEQLALAPPAADAPQYREFAWQWFAAQQKHRSDKQRRYFRMQANQLLVEVPPAEAARRWDVFLNGRSSGTPYIGKRGRMGTNARAHKLAFLEDSNILAM
jgi:hypothetical protein